jgi:aspartate/methionine/tyrosine aminotransferase
MPEISVRGLEMPESPIRKLAPLAAAAKERGIKVYHLNIGQPDLPTPQVGLDALKHIDRKVLEYSPFPGLPVLPPEAGRLLQEIQDQRHRRRYHHHLRAAPRQCSLPLCPA